MTWEELCEKARELGAIIYDGDIYIGNLKFCEDENIYFECESCELGTLIAENRTYEQMYSIMKALED